MALGRCARGGRTAAVWQTLCPAAAAAAAAGRAGAPRRPGLDAPKTAKRAVSMPKSPPPRCRRSRHRSCRSAGGVGCRAWGEEVVPERTAWGLPWLGTGRCGSIAGSGRARECRGSFRQNPWSAASVPAPPRPARPKASPQVGAPHLQRESLLLRVVAQEGVGVLALWISRGFSNGGLRLGGATGLPFRVGPRGVRAVNAGGRRAGAGPRAKRARAFWNPLPRGCRGSAAASCPGAWCTSRCASAGPVCGRGEGLPRRSGSRAGGAG